MKHIYLSSRSFNHSVKCTVWTSTKTSCNFAWIKLISLNLWCTHKSTFHQLWLSLKGIPGPFQVSLEGPGTQWSNVPPACTSLSRQGSTNLAEIQQNFRLLFNKSLKTQPKFPQCKQRHVFLKKKVIHLFHICIRFLYLWTSQAFCIHTNFALRKLLKNTFHSHRPLSKGSLQHFKSFRSTLTNTIGKSDADRHSVLLSVPFFMRAKIANGTTQSCT